MTRDNPRYDTNDDESPTEYIDATEGFARWVNHPVSPYAVHEPTERIRQRIGQVDDPIERKRLQDAVEAYEDGFLNPREFVAVLANADTEEDIAPDAFPDVPRPGPDTPRTNQPLPDPPSSPITPMEAAGYAILSTILVFGVAVAGILLIVALTSP